MSVLRVVKITAVFCTDGKTNTSLSPSISQNWTGNTVEKYCANSQINRTDGPDFKFLSDIKYSVKDLGKSINIVCLISFSKLA